MNTPRVDGLQLMILFGSRARGTHASASDADVAVMADHSLTLEDRGRVAEAVTAHLGVNEDLVDIVDLRHAPPLLAHRVGEEGALLYGDPDEFIRFRIRAWKQYLDTAKFRRAREAAILGSHAS